GESGMHEVAPADAEEQARRGHEVAVEDLDERQERGEEDYPGQQVRSKGARERRLRAEVAGDELLPGEDIRGDGDDGHIKERADRGGEEDRASEVARIESRPRLFRFFADGLEAGH